MVNVHYLSRKQNLMAAGIAVAATIAGVAFMERLGISGRTLGVLGSLLALVSLPFARAFFKTPFEKAKSKGSESPSL